MCVCVWLKNREWFWGEPWSKTGRMDYVRDQKVCKLGMSGVKKFFLQKGRKENINSKTSRVSSVFREPKANSTNDMRTRLRRRDAPA